MLAPKAVPQAPEFKITIKKKEPPTPDTGVIQLWVVLRKKKAARTTISKGKDAKYTPFCCYFSYGKGTRQKRIWKKYSENASSL